MSRGIAVLISFCALPLFVTDRLLAAPAITVGDAPLHQLANLNPLQTNIISIFYDPFAGGGFARAETIYVSVSDEGNGGDTFTADAGEPKITALDITGTVWDGNAMYISTTQVNEQFWVVDVALNDNAADANVTAGLAAKVTINRNGAPTGSTWGLRVFVGVPNLGGPYDSAWSSQPNTDSIPFTTQDDADGWQGVTDRPDGSFQYVPEPSSIALAAFALIGLAAAAWRKRRTFETLAPVCQAL